MKKQANPVVQFEIGCRNSARTSGFYRSVFGWEMNKQERSTQVSTGSEKGIDGFITSLGHEPHNYINIYVEVEDIEAAVKSIKEHGGKVLIGPLPTGEGRMFAWFHDPEGNQLALLTKLE